jgi:hypothetical protein
LDKAVSEHELKLAIEYLVLHHDALRMRFIQKEGGWQQEYGNYEGDLVVSDLRSAIQIRWLHKITQLSGWNQRSLDIEKGE